MYHLTEHFRVNGNVFKAYEYCKIGSQIIYPKDDVLFVEQFPHKGGFAYEKTILDYYVHDDKKIGLRDSTAYLLKYGEHIQNVLYNLQFYAKPISDSKVEQLNIPKPFGEDFRPSAISVLNYPFANVRYVNYLVPENNVYKTKDGSFIQTQNAFVNLDTGDVLTLMDDSSVDLPRLPTSVKGLEDIRLFAENNQVKFTATNMREYDPNIRVVTGNYNTKTGAYSNVNVLTSPNNVPCEKNWLPVPNTDHIIYNWSPLQIIKADGTTIVKHDTPPLFSLFRGSTIPIRWNSSWLVMVHFAEYSTPRKYYHCLVELEMETYRVLKVSLPFVFKTPSIEYCLSMRFVSETTLECYPSFMDSNVSKYTFTLGSLEWITLLENIQSNVVRVPVNVGVYWAGQFSECRPNGYIENFVNKLKTKKPSSFLFFQNDGIMSDDNYNAALSTTTETRLVFIPESRCNQIEMCAKSNTIPIICVLSTRATKKPNLLHVPLDDTIFEHGLSHIFKDINITSWEKRRSQVFWRGNLGGYERPSIREQVVQKLFDNIHSDVKFAFSGYNGAYSETINKKYIIGIRSNLQCFFNYKYLLIIDGVTIASNHQWTFGSGAVPIMVTHPDNNWWFKQYLIPMKHYVPIQYDLSDLEEKIQWLVDNDEQAREIAENALKLSQEIFTSNFQKEYVTNEANRILTLTYEYNKLLAHYTTKCQLRSDINEHLPTLYEYTQKCNSVVECGVRNIVSSYAFGLGLLNNSNNSYTLIDPYKSKQIDGFLDLCKQEGVNASFIEKSDLECELVETDLLFIDTWHVYGQLKRELAYWHLSVKKYIIMHDTTVDEWEGETIRCRWNAAKQSIQHNIPVEEITKGLWPAIEEFLIDHPEWTVEKRFTNNNGLTILTRCL
jgi:hypothetical protein